METRQRSWARRCEHLENWSRTSKFLQPDWSRPPSGQKSRCPMFSKMPNPNAFVWITRFNKRLKIYCKSTWYEFGISWIEPRSDWSCLIFENFCLNWFVLVKLVLNCSYLRCTVFLLPWKSLNQAFISKFSKLSLQEEELEESFGVDKSVANDGSGFEYSLKPLSLMKYGPAGSRPSILSTSKLPFEIFRNQKPAWPHTWAPRLWPTRWIFSEGFSVLTSKRNLPSNRPATKNFLCCFLRWKYYLPWVFVAARP